MRIQPTQLLYRHFKKSFERLKQDKSASAAVEFALLAIPFLTILMAMLETGYFYFIAVLLEGATAEAGRQIRTGNIQQSAAPIEAFKEQLCNNMFNVVACNDLRVDVRNFAQFSAANPPAIENNNGDETFAPGAAGDVVVARVIYEFQFITPFLGQLLNNNGESEARLLVSSAAFRNEPFGN